MKELVILTRRELWEHRALWIAPLVTAGVLVVLSAFGASAARMHFNVNGVVGDDPGFSALHAPQALKALLALSMQIFAVATIATIAYLLDCLYAERKDRSILFWKSLPVSDAKTVLVKYGLAMLVVPLCVYVLASATFLVIHGIFGLVAPKLAVALGGDALGLTLSALARMLASLLVTLLWYAPLGAWLMLASVFARRSPWLIVSLVPVGLFLAEGALFQTRHVLGFLGDRLRPAFDPLLTLQRPALWLGLVAAAGMLYIVIRLRRYRDDT
jgi:ABC-2 type transport system permease protein